MPINGSLLREAVWNDLRPFYIFLVGLFAAGALWWATSSPLYASGLLELGGLVLVAWELWELPEAWGAPTLGQKAKHWVIKLKAAFKPREDVVKSISDTLNLSENISVSKKTIPGKDAPLDEQVRFLRQELGGLQDTVKDLRSKIKNVEAEGRQALNDLRGELRTDVKVLREQAESATMGDLHKAWIGVGWLFFGIALSLL